MQKPLFKEFEDFLIDRCDEIDFEAVSQEFKKEEEQIDQIYKEFKNNLSEEDWKKFSKFNDLQNYRMASAANEAFIHGFAECLQVILYLLTAK